MYFNSQPHKEADLSLLNCLNHSNNFNSQPHKEADGKWEYSKLSENISTHSLTRRLTSLQMQPITVSVHFNSQPHKEADGLMTGALGETLAFQLTASQGG